jgi:hypothetical protein
MAATYTPIASITLGATTSSVTFSSIPSTYTDLVIITNGTMASGEESLAIQFNSDTASNYSTSFVYGSGSSAISSRQSSQTKIYVGRASTENSTSIFHIMNYANTTTNKTVLARGNNTSVIMLQCGLWRNTAAINTINISSWGGFNFSSGHTFNLYGILGANA